MTFPNGGNLMLNKVHIMTLFNLSGYGRNTVLKVLENNEGNINTVEDLREILINSKSKITRLRLPDISELTLANESALRTIDHCGKKGIRIISFNEEDFPRRFRCMPDPPILIYTKGDHTILNSQLSVAIIGTREPSSYGLRCGERFGQKFAEKNLLVVSGLAKGIDATGHKGCLAASGKTAAILAQGLDTPIYPSENKGLAMEIVQKGGCLVSEYGPLVRSRPNFFVERDRLQAGISTGVVVIETDIKGGTMHTVGFCLDQRKPLACLRHPDQYLINNPKARGNTYLIEHGKATAVASEEELDGFIKTMQLVDEKSVITNTPKKNVRNNENDGEQLRLF
ncbi:DNA-protecting protein DprA [Paenibacillus sp. TRM 82003]|nr:DNA-protecting protein DprA [Paenibacillus sp. TRM 82003]MCI3923402.1 DNA-protecting protein DprA [Paenibacillus sp. TRM 82003]